MNTGALKYLIIVLVIALVLACEKPVPELPIINTVLYPLEGATTTTFSFDMSATFNHEKNHKIFVRWDWEGDSIFDTPFLKEEEFSHRYFAAGDYSPLVEIKDLSGRTTESQYQINVISGYSSPRAAFKITPETGNTYTPFVLDASMTVDDEDSLVSLLFKWDFEGDGVWDTELNHSNVISHVFSEPQKYRPKLYVEDPSGRANALSKVLLVNLVDTCIKPDFQTEPGLLIQNQDILFDASNSFHGCNHNEKLSYRWNFKMDGLFDTEWSDDPRATHSFPAEKYYYITLQVRSLQGLEQSITKKFWIYHGNLPPQAKFTVSTFGGNTQTQFRFNSWNSKDFEDSPSQMKTRWDFENDGIWDTEYFYEKEFFRSFDQPGEYTVAMELVDQGGLRDTAYKKLYINESDYETDFILDKRGPSRQYYGTIKIGEQWWFSQNIKLYRDPTGVIIGNPYMGSGVVNVELFGYLYPFNKLPLVCPAGWRIPSKADWEILFNNLPSDDYYEELILGGKSGFNAVMGGQNAENKGQNLGKSGYYWSTKQPLDPTAASTWVITFDKAKKAVLPGYNSERNQFSVRCMRYD